MSEPDKRSDIERLLAEAEGVLGGSPTPVAPPGTVKRRAEGTSKTLRTAVVASAVSAAAIFALFALLPFLGALSGAAAAFISTFITVFVVRREVR